MKLPQPCHWREQCNSINSPASLRHIPLPTEETFEEIAVDETLWETQFAATDNGKLAALVAAVEAEISEGKTLPMFDEHGEFIEHR